MPKAIVFIIILFSFHLASFSQTTISGNSSTIDVAINSPAVVIDNTIVVTSSSTINGALVSISNNPGILDILSYTGSLPAGVTSSFNSSSGTLSFTGIATDADYQSLLRRVTYQTSSTSTQERVILFNLGTAISFAGNYHFYEFTAGSFTWAAAKTASDAKTFFGLQGYLATVTTAQENSFIQQKLSADGWLGASDEFSRINAATGVTSYATQGLSEGKWYWVTGPEKGIQFSNNNSPATQLTYMNWNSGEPNNSPNEHFGLIYSSGATPGKWNDVEESSLRGYVTEYGGMSGDPATTLTQGRNIRLIGTSVQNTAAGYSYALHAPAFAVDNAMIVYSAGSITDARVTISSGFQAGDVLGVTGSMPSGVSYSYNAATALLSFSGTTTPALWQDVFRRVTFTSTSNTVGNRVITFSVGNLISGNNGHFYQFVSTTKNWGDAKTDAAARLYLGLHGYLATITTVTENDFVRQKLTADGWIGLSDRDIYINPVAGTSYPDQNAAEGKWYWITGPEAGQQITTANAPGGGLPPVFGSAYNNWNLGEPNNSSGEHYGEFYFSGSNPGKWNDFPGSSNLGFVVEYGGLSTDPLIYLSGNRTLMISSILPARDLRFAASKEKDHSVLTWSTASESNTQRFNVMHSNDGRTFNTIGDVAAAVNSSVARHYSFIHSAPVTGLNYYRIESVDIDGTRTLSEIRQVRFSANTFTLSPNPVTTQFTVTNPFDKEAVLSIKNAAGIQVMKRTIGITGTIIDAGHLPPGFYLAQVSAGGHVPQTIKFIKK